MTTYDPTPIALTDGNIALLEGPMRALDAVGLNPITDDPEMVAACVQYLVERAGMAEDLAIRVIDALHRLASER
jgi:hypothetical protein